MARDDLTLTVVQSTPPQFLLARRHVCVGLYLLGCIPLMMIDAVRASGYLCNFLFTPYRFLTCPVTRGGQVGYEHGSTRIPHVAT